MSNSNNAVSVVKEQNKFLARVYGWMFLALVISAGVALFTATTIMSMAQTNARTMYYVVKFGIPVLAIAEIILVWWLSASINKLSAAAAGFAFVVYSILNGVTISTIFIVYDPFSIFYVFAVSAAMFAMMAVYGSVTKTNILSFGRYFMMAIIGILIASLINFFLRSNVFDTVLSIICVVIFTGLSAYDAQKMMRVSEHAHDTEVFQKASIIGALELYLDFVNIFLSLLRLFGKRK